MTTAIAISTLMLGGWVLPDMATTHGGISLSPSVELPSAPSLTNRTAAGSARQQAYGHGGSQFGSPMGRGQPQMAAPGSASASRQFVPPVPTDPEAEVPAFGTPTPVPQARSAGGLRAAGRSGYQPRSPIGRGIAGRSPTASAERARVDQRRPASPFGSSSGLQGATGGSAAAAIQRPFADYQPPPAVSPYLNLYRNDNSFDFDNYNTLVKPFEEQRRFNNRIRQDVRGLDRMSEQQQQALQRMNRQNQVFQGTTDPRHFQDTGGFYQNR